MGQQLQCCSERTVDSTNKNTQNSILRKDQADIKEAFYKTQQGKTNLLKLCSALNI